MRKGYGNFFNDTIIGLECEHLRKQSNEGSELASKRFKDIVRPIVDESLELEEILEDNKDDKSLSIINIRYKHRNIENLLNLIYPTDQMSISAVNCVMKLIEVYKCDEDSIIQVKLKALAYFKATLQRRFKGDFNLMSKLFTTRVLLLKFNDKTAPELKDLIFNFNLTQYTLNLLEGLTPRQILEVFPIDKDYKGYRYEIKDYYSSMEAINELGMDTPLNHETAKEFVMECQCGRFIFDIGVSLMRLASDYNNWDINDVRGFLSEIKSEPHLKIVKE